MKIDITALFVCLDDFCKLYESYLKEGLLPSKPHRLRQGYLSLSEIMLRKILYENTVSLWIPACARMSAKSGE